MEISETIASESAPQVEQDSTMVNGDEQDEANYFCWKGSYQSSSATVIMVPDPRRPPEDVEESD